MNEKTKYISPSIRTIAVKLHNSILNPTGKTNPVGIDDWEDGGSSEGSF